MEANTVILSLGEYNALRDFKTNLEKGNTYRTLDCQQIYNGQYVAGVLFITTDDAVKEISAKNESLMKQIEALNSENLKLKCPPKNTELTLKDVKKMSIWKFRKWRNQAW